MTRQKIKDLPTLDRPREKLARKGAQALSEFELLQVLIGSGVKDNDVGQIAKQVQDILKDGLEDLTLDKLEAINGISSAKATSLLASLELAKRRIIQGNQIYLATEDLVYLFSDLSHKKQEHLVCATFDGARRLIAKRTITIGILDSVLAHPREIYTDAVADRAAYVAIAHNHPSSVLKPSSFDIGLTQQLIAASKIIGIELIDHIIVSPNGHLSFKREGLI